MTVRLRVGVIGVGAITQLAHLPVLSRIRGVDVVALCDNDGAKARALADRFEIPDAFTDIDDLLEFDALDAVVVATPNHLHEPHVLAALNAGVDVLCERPLALDARGVEGVLAAAAKGGRKVLVANNHRFRADAQALERFIRGGELGRVTGVRSGAYQPRHVSEGWRSRRAEAGGGAFLDQGFPLVDLALWLADFPAPVRISAHMERARGRDAVETAMLVHLECADNSSFSFDASWSYVGAEERWWMECLAERGSARLAPLRVVKELNGRPVHVSPTGAAARESAFIQSYRAQAAHFLAVLRGEFGYEPPADQVTVHRVLEAAYQSANEGREVRL
jgi:predicted dehydrogenase